MDTVEHGFKAIQSGLCQTGGHLLVNTDRREKIVVFICVNPRASVVEHLFN